MEKESSPAKDVPDDGAKRSKPRRERKEEPKEPKDDIAADKVDLNASGKPRRRRGGDNDIYEAQIGTVINRTNGLSRFLLRFGLLGIFIYFSGVYRSFYYLTNYNKRLNALMAVSLLMVLSFSNELLAKPLFFGFALIYLVSPTKEVLNFTRFTFKK